MSADDEGERYVLTTAAGDGPAPVRFALAELGRGRSLGADCLIVVDLPLALRATMIHTRAAAALAARAREAGVDAVAKGRVCVMSPDPESLGDRAGGLGKMLELIPGHGRVAIVSSARNYLRVRELLDPGRTRIVLLDPGGKDPVSSLALAEARGAGFTATVVRPGRRHGVLALRSAVESRGESGQATPIALAAAIVVTTVAVGLAGLAAGVSGKGRAQGAADLAALSAARSMRDDLPRLLAPATLPNGLPNPSHMPKPVYLGRASASATATAVRNGGSPATVSIRFPDAASFAPLRSRVRIRVSGPRGPAGSAWAEARVGLAGIDGADLAFATGGGYSGPLAIRQGHGMRPDVALAFDRMQAAAAADGVTLTITSGYRSDAEQARLFAANPDPRWVAPPGRSLHRCATELDLGPPSAYAWLAANAGRFGFLKRYSWEPWHFGFVAGSPPCSASSRAMGIPREGSRAGALPVPAFVPARYRKAILGASLATGVPAGLLAAQLKAESNFDPRAISSAGALGIAQFMPATAASQGLRDPFDPYASIAAQARLMASLIRQFGSARLALAAYNAGPGAVASCGCVPPYAETLAYVARVLSLAGASTGSVGLPMEIELVD